MNRIPGHPNRITQEVREKILALKEYGCNGMEISQRLGISRVSVTGVLREHGIVRQKRRPDAG